MSIGGPFDVMPFHFVPDNWHALVPLCTIDMSSAPSDLSAAGITFLPDPSESVAGAGEAPCDVEPPKEPNRADEMTLDDFRAGARKVLERDHAGMNVI